MKLYVHAAVEPLLEAIVAHPGGTVLLHGMDGVGKYTTACDIARRINCVGCVDGSCRSCRMAAGGNHPNIMIIEPDEKHKIGIDAVHALQHNLQYEQYETSGHQVVVIRDAHTLTLPAQNALLKTLEEPPVGTTIVATAITPTALLSTVLSRCRLVFMPVANPALIKQALAELVPDQGDRYDEAVRLSGGAVGLAVNLAREPEQLQTAAELLASSRNLITDSQVFERLRTAAEIAADTANQAAYVNSITELAREAARTGSERAESLLVATANLRSRLRANVVPKTAFEAFALEVA